jgi:hypothetical protein
MWEKPEGHARDTLLVPEQFLPSQLPPARNDSLIRGEKALLLAILEDAVRCLAGRNGTRTRLVREAEAWVRADDHAWPFSFLNVCEHLGFDAHRLRGVLLARAEPGRARDQRRQYRLHLRLKPSRRLLRTPSESRRHHRVAEVVAPGLTRPRDRAAGAVR